MSNQDSGAEHAPHAVVTRRKRRFSLVWLVPVVAALNSGLRLAGFPRQYGLRLMKTF